jgi:hypothetical protein
MELTCKKFTKQRLDDSNDIVYFDSQKGFYIIKWEDGGDTYIPVKHYIETKKNLNFFEKIKKFLSF